MINKETICPKCKGNKLIKRGILKTESKGNRQRLGCKNCNHRFIIDEPFKRMRNHELIITQCMDLYYSGMSFRKIADHLQKFFPKGVHHSTIYRWIIKYIPIMKNFTDKQKLEGVTSLQGDEVEYHRRKYNNRKGVDRNWFVDIIDTKSRYIVSSDYSTTRDLKSMTKTWSRAKRKVGDSVKYISTDGLYIYDKTLKNTFGLRTRNQRAVKKSPVIHKIIKSTSKTFNYKIERFHNSLRERTKVMRGFHGRVSSAQTIMKGYEIYYNWIREHQGLNGLTPSQIAIPNIQIENKNGWLELIQRGYNGN